MAVFYDFIYRFEYWKGFMNSPGTTDKVNVIHNHLHFGHVIFRLEELTLF